jgi:hypothetical protein
VVLLRDHVQRLAEITGQAAANAPGIHLVHGHTGILQKAAVNADLPKFIFNENQFFPRIALGNELFDEGGLTGSQEAGNNVNSCHEYRLSGLISSNHLL